MAPFFIEKFNMTENNNEDQRPSKMIGVLFPKAKYGGYCSHNNNNLVLI